MRKIQRNIKVVKTLNDITVKPRRIRHKFYNCRNVSAFKRHTARHNKAYIAAAENYYFLTRKISVDINQLLGSTCREYACAAHTCNIDCASRTFAAAAGKYYCFCLQLNKSVFRRNIGYDFAVGNVYYGCIKFVANIAVDNFGYVTRGIFGTCQFFLKGVQTETVVYTLIEYSAEFRLAFEYQNVAFACVIRRFSRGKTCRTAAYDHNVC